MPRAPVKADFMRKAAPRKSAASAPAATRTRKTAEASRRAILEAAERQLGEVGPAGLRLQEVAREVGLSHPAILHHFGSREELLREVVRNATANLEAELVRVLAEAGRDEAPPALETIEHAFHVLVQKGHARVLAWLLLSGQDTEPAARIRMVAEAAHTHRLTHHADADPEDTLFRTLLVALTLLGEAVAGPAMRKSAGLGDDPDAAARFRKWLAVFVVSPPTTPG
jgi:AcrR family transcriptional regulator